jgi:uncharacterized protein
LAIQIQNHRVELWRIQKMKPDTPFIVPIKTKKGNDYIYDVVTNCIFPSNEITIAMLNIIKKVSKEILFQELLKTYQFDKISSVYRKVRNWIEYERAFFPADTLKISPMLKKAEFVNKLINCSHMVLAPTNQCNLRCKYCTFSGEYINNRVHNDLVMNFDVAKMSIDYFASLLTSNSRTAIQNRGTIGFYGGEPLLHFSLIKKCMDYVKSIGCDDLIFWNITSNGTLLTKEKLKYFIKYENIRIGISLDGPENDHNRHRVFRNGIGTFRILMKNLQLIFTLAPEFYKKHIHFQPVLPRFNNPHNLLDFFTSNPLVSNNELTSQIGDVTPGAKTFYKKLTKENMKIFNKRYAELFKTYINLLIEGNVKSRKFQVLSALAGDIFQNIDRRVYRHLDDLFFTTGTCIPGTRKFYVSPEGDFFICEKVAETHEIGNCYTGIDYKKCKKVYEKYINNVTADCYKCPYIHFCTLCFAPAEDRVNFNTMKYCEDQQTTLTKRLSDYYSILEENPHVFELIGTSNAEKEKSYSKKAESNV